MVKYYRRAYKLRLEQTNRELWLQGMYVYEAIADLAPILRTSFSKTPPRALDYPHEPYALGKEEIEMRKKKEEESKFAKNQSKVTAWASRVNAHFAKSKEVTP